ncbi:hypothetical protein [Enterovibrio norvegicus]|uniref:hypothetical protein n=1 Tax=Enterovibrio norvegicus TaxID=188144 RepID=UPI00352F427C
MIVNILRVLTLLLLVLAVITFSVNHLYDLKEFPEDVTYFFSVIVIGSPVLVIPSLIAMVGIDLFSIIKLKSAKHWKWLGLDLFVPLLTLFLTFSVLKNWIDSSGMV